MSAARQDWTAAVLVVVVVLLAGCGMLGQQGNGVTSTAGPTSAAPTETGVASIEEPQVGTDVNLEAALLVDSQLPSAFALSYEASRPEPLAGSPVPEDGGTNRFINQEVEDGETVIIQSTVARYATAADATSGLRASITTLAGTNRGEQRIGDVLGTYRIATFQNERGYAVTVLYHRYGNVVHGVIVTGESETEATGLKLTRLQYLQLRRLLE